MAKDSRVRAALPRFAAKCSFSFPINDGKCKTMNAKSISFVIRFRLKMKNKRKHRHAMHASVIFWGGWIK